MKHHRGGATVCTEVKVTRLAFVPTPQKQRWTRGFTHNTGSQRKECSEWVSSALFVSLPAFVQSTVATFHGLEHYDAAWVTINGRNERAGKREHQSTTKRHSRQRAVKCTLELMHFKLANKKQFSLITVNIINILKLI